MTTRDFLCFRLNHDNLEPFTFPACKGYFLNSCSLLLGKKSCRAGCLFLMKAALLGAGQGQPPLCYWIHFCKWGSTKHCGFFFLHILGQLG